MSLVLDSMNPFELVVNYVVFCKGFIFFVLSRLSFLMLSFLLDPGRAFMSGKNDYDDFIKDSVVFSGIYDFISILDSFCLS